MSEKRKRNWIKISTPENEDRIASPEYVKRLMGLDVNFQVLNNRIQKLEYKMDRVEAPQRHKEILRLLEKYGKHNLTWIKNRVSNYQWYDLSDLIDRKLIVESKSGTVTMYRLTGDNR